MASASAAPRIGLDGELRVSAGRSGGVTSPLPDVLGAIPTLESGVWVELGMQSGTVGAVAADSLRHAIPLRMDGVTPDVHSMGSFGQPGRGEVGAAEGSMVRRLLQAAGESDEPSEDPAAVLAEAVGLRLSPVSLVARALEQCRGESRTTILSALGELVASAPIQSEPNRQELASTPASWAWRARRAWRVRQVVVLPPLGAARLLARAS